MESGIKGYITAYSAGLVATQTKRYRRNISFKNQNLVLKWKHEVTRVLSTWESKSITLTLEDMQGTSIDLPIEMSEKCAIGSEKKTEILTAEHCLYRLHDFAFLYFIAVTFRMKNRLIYITANSAGLVATQTKRYRGKVSWWSAFDSHMDNTRVTSCFHFNTRFWFLKLTLPRYRFVCV
jgi:hypothetical protein